MDGLREISVSDDIVEFVDAFYERVRNDDILGPIFQSTMSVDWDVHLPKMYSFWETVLFHENGYKGNPVEKHLDVARKVQLNASHFSRWFELFELTIDERFHGEVAEIAKLRAQTISSILLHKCSQVQ